MNGARPVLVTGGAGFIGSNVVDHLAASGRAVIVYDNLARGGSSTNLAWLRRRHPDAIETVIADVRDAATLRQAVRRAGHVFHFAAQVAVTTSLEDPTTDFEMNALGTLNVLEAIRSAPEPPSLVYTSTNKVYGALEDLALVEDDHGCRPSDPTRARAGIDETQPLSLYTPYGCSKGCADQYVLDYARVFGLRASVFRMSCIYGPRQNGTEDQGWVAHFLLRILAGDPIIIYGNGRQVRDLLFVDDLVNALAAVQARLEGGASAIAGQVFNVGGGPANAVSLLEVIELLADSTGVRPEVRFGPARAGDQRYYVSDTSKIARTIGWAPAVNVREGLRRLQRALEAREQEPAVPPLAWAAHAAHADHGEQP